MWLDMHCPEGQSVIDENFLFRLPEHLREGGRRVCRRRWSIGQSKEGGGKGRGVPSLNPLKTRGVSQQGSVLPHYTDVVKGRGQVLDGQRSALIT